ncbi:18848_t:CDS:2, partial [Dentiscutata erythropus]
HVKLNLNVLLVRLQNIESKKPKPFQYLNSIVRACDEFLITRNGYCQLAAIMPDIEFLKLAYNDSPVLQIGDIIHIKLSGDSRQVEQYELLQQAFSFLIDELLLLKAEGIINSKNNHWLIEFWFSSN